MRKTSELSESEANLTDGWGKYTVSVRKLTPRFAARSELARQLCFSGRFLHPKKASKYAKLKDNYMAENGSNSDGKVRRIRKQGAQSPKRSRAKPRANSLAHPNGIAYARARVPRKSHPTLCTVVSPELAEQFRARCEALGTDVSTVLRALASEWANGASTSPIELDRVSARVREALAVALAALPPEKAEAATREE